MFRSLQRGMKQYNRQQIEQEWNYFGQVDSFNKEEGRDYSLSKTQFAVCGAIAGAIGGSITTPMDVAKTRIMLAKVSLTLKADDLLVLHACFLYSLSPGYFAG